MHNTIPRLTCAGKMLQMDSVADQALNWELLQGDLESAGGCAVSCREIATSVAASVMLEAIQGSAEAKRQQPMTLQDARQSIAALQYDPFVPGSGLS